jgi:hypothetical protein
MLSKFSPSNYCSNFFSYYLFNSSIESTYSFFSSNETISNFLITFKVIFGVASLLFLNSSEISEAESEISSYIDFSFIDFFFCLAVRILWVSDAINDTLKIACS